MQQMTALYIAYAQVEIRANIRLWCNPVNRLEIRHNWNWHWFGAESSIAATRQMSIYPHDGRWTALGVCL